MLCSPWQNAVLGFVCLYRKTTTTQRIDDPWQLLLCSPWQNAVLGFVSCYCKAARAQRIDDPSRLMLCPYAVLVFVCFSCKAAKFREQMIHHDWCCFPMLYLSLSVFTVKQQNSENRWSITTVAVLQWQQCCSCRKSFLWAVFCILVMAVQCFWRELKVSSYIFY